MIWWILGYWVVAAIYCGASAVSLRINNTSLLVLGLFAPILCWVFFGLRLAGGTRK